MSIFLVGDIGVWWAFGDEGRGCNKVNFAKRAKSRGFRVLRPRSCVVSFEIRHNATLHSHDLTQRKFSFRLDKLLLKCCLLQKVEGYASFIIIIAALLFGNRFQLLEKVYYNFFYFWEFSRWNKFLQEAEMFICFQTRPFWTRTTYP